MKILREDKAVSFDSIDYKREITSEELISRERRSDLMRGKWRAKTRELRSEYKRVISRDLDAAKMRELCSE